MTHIVPFIGAIENILHLSIFEMALWKVCAHTVSVTSTQFKLYTWLHRSGDGRFHYTIAQFWSNTFIHATQTQHTQQHSILFNPVNSYDTKKTSHFHLIKQTETKFVPKCCFNIVTCLIQFQVWLLAARVMRRSCKRNYSDIFHWEYELIIGLLDCYRLDPQKQALFF